MILRNLSVFAAISIVVQGVDSNTTTINMTTSTLISDDINTNTTNNPICENGGSCCNSPDPYCRDYQFEINGRKGTRYYILFQALEMSKTELSSDWIMFTC